MEEEYRRFTRQLVKEYREHQNPPVDPDTEVVWVLSGRGSYDLQRGKTPKDDLEYIDDRERIDFAVELAKEITALRLRKTPGQMTKQDLESASPIIYYNGEEDQNNALRQAVESPNFPFPQTKIIIDRIHQPPHAYTPAQFHSFPSHFLDQAIKEDHPIAIVTHRYHLLRSQRYPLAPNILAINPKFKDVKILWYAADQKAEKHQRMKRAVSIRRLLKREANNIPEYTEKGDLSPWERKK